MPILRCYVSDDTMKILEREASVRDGETAETLAENAIAEAAIRSVAPSVRPNFNVEPPRPRIADVARHPDWRSGNSK